MTARTMNIEIEGEASKLAAHKLNRCSEGHIFTDEIADTFPARLPCGCPKIEGHKVKLTCHNDNFTGARVWIDGMEVVDLTSIQIGVGVGEVNSVKLEFIPAELDIEVNAADPIPPPTNPGKPS